MDDQYTGECIVGLMNTINESLRRSGSNQDNAEPKVKPGGIVVDVGGIEVCVSPDTVELFRRIGVRRRLAIANGEPPVTLRLSQDPQVVRLL